MKEAYGGIFNMLFLIVFLVIAIGVLGLTFSYTKAFKMKNAVIAAIEEYEGNVNHAGCIKQIKNSAQGLGYSPVSTTCPDHYTMDSDGFYCYHEIPNSSNTTSHFSIIVQTDISFPLMKQIFGFSLFQVSGETKEMKIRYKD